MSGEVTLANALERIEASVRDRNDGLADLKHILRRNPHLDGLHDASVHRIFEVLFRVAMEDRTVYLKAATPTTRTAAAKRLSACSSALRLTVEVTTGRLRLKTLRALLDHVVQTFNSPDNTPCEPLALDYARSLKALLSFHAHVEHLSQMEKNHVAHFCVENIKTLRSELPDDEADPGIDPISGGVATSSGLGYRSSRSHLKEPLANSQQGRSLMKQVAEEMVSCLSLLTAAPNAAMGGRSSEMLWALIHFLQTTASTRQSHQDAFAGINHILSWSRTENTVLVLQAIGQLSCLVSKYWNARASASLKDEMLIALLYLRPYVLCLMQKEIEHPLRSDLISAFHALRDEYCKRHERDQLHLEDLKLGFGRLDDRTRTSIQCPIYSLRHASTRAEAAWTTVSIMATLYDLSSQESDETYASDPEDDHSPNRRPRKRRRISSELEAALQALTNDLAPNRITALQTLLFSSQQKACSGVLLERIIDALLAICADDNVSVASWAFLTMAGFASQSSSADSSLASRWTTVWPLAIRAMSNAYTSRQACYLLHILMHTRLVPGQYDSDLVRIATTTMDLNGPTILADSVACLLQYVVRAAHRMKSTSSSTTAERVLTWLFGIFTPSRFEDRLFANRHVLYESADVVDLISSCLGNSCSHRTGLHCPLWGKVGQVWLACAESRDLLDYLLLLPESTPPSQGSLIAETPAMQSSLPTVNCETVILNNMISELACTLKNWTQKSWRSLSVDMFASFCKSCQIAVTVSHCTEFCDSRRTAEMQEQAQSLLVAMSDFAGSSLCPQDKLDVMLVIFTPSLSALLVPSEHLSCCACERAICKALSDALDTRNKTRELSGDDDFDDLMELDEDHDSQASRHRNQLVPAQEPQHHLASTFSGFALRRRIATYTAIQSHAPWGEVDSAEAAVRNRDVVHHLLSLGKSDLLASRCVISRLADLGVDLTADIVERLVSVCLNMLDTYDFERSEVALAAILDIMSSLASTLTDPEMGDLYKDGIDVYRWYTVVALPKRALSPHVQEKLANFLLQLCHIDTEYGRDEGGQSVRTSIFRLIELGSVSVQHYIANRISTIFELFVLANHPAMFSDLQQSLPSDSDRIEDMAVRLLFLSRLASTWHSLLRHCVYYIFEAAGRAKTAPEFATRSISNLAKSLNFQSPQQLFNLFAPQLLHTWLENYTVTKLPFAIFHYASLEHLLSHNLPEIVAQLLVRGSEDGMLMLTSQLKIKDSDLARRCFAKCMAYCISWDISKSTEAEAALRSRVGGKESVRQLVLREFPVVLGQVFLCTQNEDVQDKWIERRDHYKHAAEALRIMKQFSHSDQSLPACQEPSFKSKFLCDQIERLSRRIGRDPYNPWDTSCFAFVARMLLDSINDALGPLHTCLVIRRLRLLICLGGEFAVSGYAVEMLVHTLRPFLSDSHCADDVMGVLQFLLDRGRNYLVAHPQFLNGTITLMILQMRKHSIAKQDSSTQETQHKATVRRMQGLHTWLIEYLRSNAPTEKASTFVGHRRLANALNSVYLPGNAQKGSAESELLLLVMSDYHKGVVLLTEADREECVTILSDNFKLPRTLGDDCLSRDVDCILFAEQLWHMVRLPHLSDAFMTWVSTALGRAYAATGSRPSRTERTSQRSTHRENGLAGMAKSQASIVKRLSEGLFARDRPEATAADYTLRNLLLSLNDDQEAIAFESMLADPLVSAFDRHLGYSPQAVLQNFAVTKIPLERLVQPSVTTSLAQWAQQLSLSLCREADHAPTLRALIPALENSITVAVDLLPCIIHISLFERMAQESVLRVKVSECVTAHFAASSVGIREKQSYLMKLLLYLLAQTFPGERTQLDRLRWLQVDWIQASEAAMSSNMLTTALMFLELASVLPQTNRRTSNRASAPRESSVPIPQQLLLRILTDVDEPDSFYGVEQPASLDSVLGRLDYEQDGFKSLMFRSAQLDSNLLVSGHLDSKRRSGMIRSLAMLNLNSVTFSLLSGGRENGETDHELLDAARKLQQWDLPLPEASSGPALTTFTVFRELIRARDCHSVQSKVQSILLDHTKSMLDVDRPNHEWFGALASLVETKDALIDSNECALRSSWERMSSRQNWMRMGSFEHTRPILWNRHTLFSVFAQNRQLVASARDLRGCRILEIEALLQQSFFAREHGQLQEALVAVNRVDDLLARHGDMCLRADSATKFETSLVLWEAKETTASVNLLHEALNSSDLERQEVSATGKSGVLAQLAHQLAEARLEKPDVILSKYLEPAIRHLGARTDGDEAGHVFFEFATFCDKQLQNAGNVEDFERIKKMRQKKQDDVKDLEKLQQASRRASGGKHGLKAALDKAQAWFEIDDNEYQTLAQIRNTYLQQSLKNYLLALRATSQHDICVLRYFALWLECSDVHDASDLAGQYLHAVPSWKFVSLMNQLVSRLEHVKSAFQQALSALLQRICSDHPHHSLHHLFAATRPPSAEADTAAVSRQKAASIVRSQVQSSPRVERVLTNIFLANNCYRTAAQSDTKAVKVNQIPTGYWPATKKMAAQIPSLAVPPITINEPLCPDGNYEGVPVIARFSSTIRLMGGNSRPMKIVVYASNGQQHAEVMKGNTDDLRQDAVMEQVFDEVGKMLRNHKTTRQRNLNIRTYKVVPLSTNSGIIEFVPNSISFTEFLIPAHERYHPHDMKNSEARSIVSGVAQQSTGARIKEFHKICERFQPVMRHFFFERYREPDDWFEKRTTYTRTTAAISILGYILGLGDRHCQNIMMDEKTGEVVHIDLGIAFEAGRILRIPELVPFRLSRDVVDGMGITKTEGVFRRCCKFMLDALREDKDSIMTLLDVLRYDPLFGWNVTPLRANRMQEEAGRQASSAAGPGGAKKGEEEGGEAQRALSVVAKKLSKTLSTTATVNELIQQATDEKNLATLFSGWSAWC